MNLVDRPAEPRDFPACVDLLRGRLAYADVIAHLPDAWQRLYRDGALVGTIVENRERLTRSRMVVFGMSVFVTDEFMAEARRGCEPYLSARVIRRELNGSLSPILRPAAIRAANSSHGLSLLVLHYGEATAGLSPVERYRVRHKMLDVFLMAHRGYRLNEVLQEFWDDIELAYVLRGWGLVRSDYSEYFKRRGLRPPPPECRPHLVGLTGQEAVETPGLAAAQLFAYAPPRFFFRPAEQRLLIRALSGETDDELSLILSLALSTVKSVWRAVYQRVTAVDPDLCPCPGDGDTGPVRGREKRRRILEYLRHHPEELRPVVRHARGANDCL